jgi:RimJ/RimL family protein N-acetyltransferase
VKSIRLIDVYAQQPDNSAAILFLYELLAERDPIANISHRKMPTFEQHREFIDSLPYRAWYIIFTENTPIGAVYLTYKNEIGVSILKAHQENGYGKMAIELLMKLHPEKKFLANIAPGNARSISMFEGLGFELIQITLAKEQADG